MRPPFLLSASLIACATSSAWAMDSSDVQFHGFASQGYLVTTGSDLQGRTTGGGTFDFNDFALNATATPADRVRIGVQLFAGDLGKYGNDVVKLDFAYGAYQMAMPVPWADVSLSAGRVKMGLGLYNDFRDLDMTRTTVFLPLTVYATGFRDLFLAGNGAEVNATLRAGKLGSFDLSGFVGGQNAEHNQGSPIGDSLSAGLVTIDNFDVKRSIVAGVTWNTPVDGLRVKWSFEHAQDVTLSGVSGDLVAGPFSPPTYSMQGQLSLYNWILSTEYQAGDLTLAAEYSCQRIKMETDLSIAGGPPIQTFSSGRDRAGYISASYQLNTKWSVATGWNWEINDKFSDNPVPALQAALDAAQAYEHRGVVAAACFTPKAHWLIKAEIERNRGNAITDQSDPTSLSRYWTLFALKTTFDF